MFGVEADELTRLEHIRLAQGYRCRMEGTRHTLPTHTFFASSLVLLPRLYRFTRAWIFARNHEWGAPSATALYTSQ